jgi:hypothetical protein
MQRYKFKIGQTVKTSTRLGEYGDKFAVIISRKRYTDTLFHPIEYKVLICGLETPQYFAQDWLSEIEK